MHQISKANQWNEFQKTMESLKYPRIIEQHFVTNELSLKFGETLLGTNETYRNKLATIGEARQHRPQSTSTRSRTQTERYPTRRTLRFRPAPHHRTQKQPNVSEDTRIRITLVPVSTPLSTFNVKMTVFHWLMIRGLSQFNEQSNVLPQSK